MDKRHWEAEYTNELWAGHREKQNFEPQLAAKLPRKPISYPE